MNLIKKIFLAGAFCSGMFYAGCKTPALVKAPEVKATPETFDNNSDSSNSAHIQWKDFFADKKLADLIDTALKNNQELAITLQEVAIAKNDIRTQKGKLFPVVEGGVGVGVEKVGRYTSQGAGDASTQIKEGKAMPEWLPDYFVGVSAHWEADVWKKLHNSTQAAVDRYLSTMEGRNFVITNLIAEIANGYYELLALDDQLRIVEQTIVLQKNALEVVRVQKQAAAATELAVKKFEAEVLKSQSLEFEIRQKIKAGENEINYLLGRYPQSIVRDTTGILNTALTQVSAGIPSQLLKNRPDIRQAELELSAAKLDVKVARAEFYPSFNISSSLGFQAFNPAFLVKFPESLLASIAGDVAGPLINKNAIRAEYLNANARQIQAVYNYEKTILNACIEVSTSLSKMSNYKEMYDLKNKQVNTLISSIDISGALFRSARADYLEVLLTQRDALEAKLELIETKLQQQQTVTNIYRALGGGWN